MPQYKLTYFNIRGRAEVARYLFALAGVEYEDCRIERTEWPSLKENTPFGQIPLLEVDGKVICQSHSIERYLARKFGLSGKTEWDQARADMIIECMEDYISPMIAMRQEENEDKKNEILRRYIEEQSPQFLDSLDKILKENGDWSSGHFIGSELTVADLIFIHMTDTPTRFTGKAIPESWDKWPALAAVREAVNNNPKIKEWIEKRPKTNQ